MLLSFTLCWRETEQILSSYPSENLRFSDVFSGNRNELIHLILQSIWTKFIDDPLLLKLSLYLFARNALFARNIFFIKDIDINDHNYLSEQNTMKWLERQDYMPFKIILKQVSMSIYQTCEYRKPEKPEDKFKTPTVTLHFHKL